MSQPAIRPLTRPARIDRAFTTADLDRLHAEFNENGFVVVRDVVPRDQLHDLHLRISEEFQRARGTGALFNGGGGLMSGHLNCFAGEAARFAYQAITDRGIVDLIRKISPGSTREPNVGCNFNLPGSVTQHYHMDRTFTNEFMIANIAVVDADLVNGAIDVIPGTHKQFYPYWKFELGRVSRNHQRLPMQAGDVLVRVSNLWHRGMPNRSAVPRPMLAFTWEDGGSVYDDPFQVDGGAIMFRPNWFRPSRLGRIRERVFVSAPFTYSAYRVVDSLLTDKGYA